MPRKRGKLSTEEENQIKQSVSAGLKLEDIALNLNRTLDTIERYCKRKKLTYREMSEEVYDNTILKSKLEERAYWPQVQQQFSEEELEYFVETWIEMIKQFREDILYAEELQLKQWITLEIMGNKVMRDRLGAHNQIQRVQDLLDAEYELDEALRDVDTIANLEQEVAMLRNTQGSYTTEHAKILDKIEKIQRDLKAARADRVRKVEDSKSSFAGFLKALEDESLRKTIGEDIEINKIAKDKAIERLSEYHTYENGEVDQPFLNVDTLKD